MSLKKKLRVVFSNEMKGSSSSAGQPGSLLKNKRVIRTVRKILNGCDDNRNEIWFVFRSIF